MMGRLAASSKRWWRVSRSLDRTGSFFPQLDRQLLTSALPHRNEAMLRGEADSQRERLNTASLETNAPARELAVARQRSGNLQVVWKSLPQNVLVIKKPDDGAATRALLAISRWLVEEKKMNIILENSVAAALADTIDFPVYTVGNIDECVAEDDSEEALKRRFQKIDRQREELARVVDFIVTLGGDGTILHVSTLFDRKCPPVISFSMGTLGFLMPFDVKDFRKAISMLIDGHVSAQERMRLSCDVHLGANNQRRENKEGPRFWRNKLGPLTELQAMNEVTLHRGTKPNLMTTSIQVNGEPLSDALADGLIVSTPTGSTAYSLSAGGPIIHPTVNSLLLTPVCPRSLSFRPLILPQNTILDLKILSARNGNAELNLDGRDTVVLEQGDSIKVRASGYPVPTINRIQEGVDWCRDINDLLKWNQSFANKHNIERGL